MMKITLCAIALALLLGVTFQAKSQVVRRSKTLSSINTPIKLTPATLQAKNRSEKPIQCKKPFRKCGTLVALERANAIASSPKFLVVDPTPAVDSKVQIALLLDTSNSMDGLLVQAKTQLWQMVNQLSLATRDGQAPTVQVALYEYGKSSLPASEGFLRLIVPLTTDLDLISEQLFELTTNGGEEYCGQVIASALDELQWSQSPSDLRMIYIAGNEPFTQGPIHFQKVCRIAQAKGILINTIFCGNKNEGIRTSWRDGALLGGGQFNAINQNRRVIHIVAPQDTVIIELSRQLNETYVPYGATGQLKRVRQLAQDKNASSIASEVAVQRAKTKASKLYENKDWDLVDAVKKGLSLSEVSPSAMPKSMRLMSGQQRQNYLKKQQHKRADLQRKIKEVTAEREKYIQEKLRQTKQNKPTLQSAMAQSLRHAAEKKGFSFKKK